MYVSFYFLKAREVTDSSERTGLSAEQVLTYAKMKRTLSLQDKQLDKFKEVGYDDLVSVNNRFFCSRCLYCTTMIELLYDGAIQSICGLFGGVSICPVYRKIVSSGKIDRLIDCDWLM